MRLWNEAFDGVDYNSQDFEQLISPVKQPFKVPAQSEQFDDTTSTIIHDEYANNELVDNRDVDPWEQMLQRKPTLADDDEEFNLNEGITKSLKTSASVPGGEISLDAEAVIRSSSADLLSDSGRDPSNLKKKALRRSHSRDGKNNGAAKQKTSKGLVDQVKQPAIETPHDSTKMSPYIGSKSVKAKSKTNLHDIVQSGRQPKSNVALPKI
jgi:hypothetical protein